MNSFKKISKCRICKSKKIAEYLDLEINLSPIIFNKKQIPKEKNIHLN